LIPCFYFISPSKLRFEREVYFRREPEKIGNEGGGIISFLERDEKVGLKFYKKK